MNLVDRYEEYTDERYMNKHYLRRMQLRTILIPFFIFAFVFSFIMVGKYFGYQKEAINRSKWYRGAVNDPELEAELVGELLDIDWAAEFANAAEAAVETLSPK